MTAKVKTERIGEAFSIKKGVRQGDPLSPKLFSATLEHVFRKLEWSNYGIRINGEMLNHLRFADDLIIISDNPDQLQTMLNQLVKESQEVGLQMNLSKTKLMTNRSKINILVNNDQIEYVDEYTYLGQIISPTNDTLKETQNRVDIAWKRYWSLKEITKNQSIPMKLKSKVFNSCILPTMTYGCQTWAPTLQNTKKLQTCQHSMERSMLNVKRRDKVNLNVIRLKTKTIDVSYTIKKLKLKWAGHLIRNKTNKWAKQVAEWYPREGKRKRGRPSKRWDEDLKAAAGIMWRRKTYDRDLWKNLGEAYATAKQSLPVPKI